MSKLMTATLVSILIILVTGLLIFKSEAGIKEIYKKANEKKTCEVSVETHAALKMRYADFSGDIKCPMIKLEIKDKNEEIVKKKIADAMYDCWDQFGKGKLDLFADNSVYCTICHRITFDKDVKVNGLTQYLATKNAPGQKISYSQFMTTERTQNSDILKNLEKNKIEDSLDASKQNEYAVIFTYIKGKKNLDEFLEKSKHVTTGLGIVGVGFGVFKAGGFIGGSISLIPIPGAAIVGVTVGVSISSAGALIMSVGALWTGLGGYFASVPFEHISLINFIPYDAQNLQNLNCERVPIKQA